MIWLLVLVPVIAAVQRYAVSYGYEGNTREQALHEALGVLIVVGALCAVIGGMNAVD